MVIIDEDLKFRWGIYKIRNKINDYCYIGRSENIYRRWNTHIYHLKKKTHTNLELQADVDFFGLDAFEFSVIEYVPSHDKTELAFRELDNIYSFVGNLYNVPSPKDKEIYSLCLLLKKNNIPFGLSCKFSGVLVDLVIYDPKHPEEPHSVIDVHRNDPIFTELIKKRQNMVESFGVKFLSVEPDDPWWSFEQIIRY